MTEDNLSLQQSVPAIEPSISKQRKKRRWDQPDESLVACGVVLPGMLAMSTVGSPGVSPPGAFSSSCAPSTSLLKVANVSIQSPVVQQQAAAVVQKLNQSKIQEELIIAREIVINDADPAMRYKLTKRQTQEEIQKCTGAVVITRGKYRPPNAVPDGEKPLYLHISGGAHLKETAERILAVDRAAAMVEDMLKQAPHPLSTCVYLGFDADPSLNIAAKIRGPNDQYINHIINETGALVVLRGRGSGYLGNTIGEGGQQPLHLLLSSNNQKSLEAAKVLAENLLDTISRECGANRVSSCKVYGAVPAPQQLLVGVQSPGTEMHEYLSTASSMASSAATSVPSIPALPAVAPVIPTTFSYGSLVQSGNVLPPGLACANGLPYSPPPLTACTSYSGYAGVYPQATPLQQVSLALRQSGPVSSTVAPAISAARVLPKSSSESEMRPPSKRKFQESPAAFNGPASLQQESDLQDPHKCPSHMEKSKSETPPPLTLKSLLPPPAPRTNSSICSVDSLKRVQSPPPQPPPMINSSLSVSRGISKGINKNGTSISINSSSPAVPDTLVKLMEYGDDDDDDDEDTDESGNESLKKSVNENTTSKPFWAV